MDKILKTSGSTYLPSCGSRAYQFLSILADGKSHPLSELLRLMEIDPRSPRQSLCGKNNGYWLVHNIGDGSAIYVLDERHLSGDTRKDADARVIAKKILKDRSMNQSIRESSRLSKALAEYEEAEEEYQQRFVFTDKEKPLKD